MRRRRSLLLPLAGDAVLVTVQLGPVSGLASIERRRTRITSRLAVAVVDAARVGLGLSRCLARAGRGTGSGISLARIRALFRPQSRGSCHRRGCGSLCRRHRRRRVDHRWHRRRAVNNRGDRGWRIDHGGPRRRLLLRRWSMIRGASSAKPGPENERHGIRDKLPQEIPAPRHGPIGLTGPSVRECWWDGRWRGGVHWCLKSREGIMAASRDK